jgi:hypothetical protein
MKNFTKYLILSAVLVAGSPLSLCASHEKKLIHAVESGKLERVTRVCKKYSAEIEDYAFGEALRIAASKNFIKIVRYLSKNFKKKISNRYFRESFVSAANNIHLWLVKYLARNYFTAINSPDAVLFGEEKSPIVEAAIGADPKIHDYLKALLKEKYKCSEEEAKDVLFLVKDISELTKKEDIEDI